VENQRLEILKLANDLNLGQVKMIDEVISGRKSWRERSIAPIIMLDLQKGDVLIVSELSRLGRSMLEIMEMLSQCAQKGIRVYAAKGNWKLDGSLQTKIMAMVLSMAAEIERDLISQRTRSALATKKAQGVRLGRPTCHLQAHRRHVFPAFRLLRQLRLSGPGRTLRPKNRPFARGK
jgi:DNA invertase Pin-like site-specific DNA recombinase